MNNLISKKEVSFAKYFLFAFFAVSIVGIFYWVLLKPMYAINDDTSMARIAYGYHGEYGSNLVFINPLIGMAIKLLIQMFPTVPWYAVFQCIVVFTSFLAITYVFFSEKGFIGAIFPTTVLFAFFGYAYFCRIQFSQTAGIACIAGFLLFFTSFSGKIRIGRIVCGMVLVFIGSLYRMVVFKMLLIPFFGVGLYLVSGFVKGRRWMQFFVCVGCIIVLFWACYALRTYHQNIMESTEEWAEYKEYNSLRAKLTDYDFPDFDENNDLYERLGITKDDYLMYMSWNFADPDIFNISSMSQLVAAKSPRELSVMEFIIQMVKGWIRYSFFPAFTIAFFLVLVDLMEQKKKLWIALYEIIAFGAANAYMYISGRYLMARIDISLMMAVSSVLLLFCQNTEKLRKKDLLIVTAIFILAIFNEGIETIQENIETWRSDTEIAENNDILRYFVTNDKEHLYLSQVSTLSKSMNLWDIQEKGVESNMYSLGGWRTNSPFSNGVLRSYGIYNPFKECVDNPDVFFLTNTNLDISMSVEYIQRHYSATASAEQTKEFGEYCVYRIVSDNFILDTSKAIHDSMSYNKNICTIEDYDGNTVVNGMFDMDPLDYYKCDVIVGVTNGTVSSFCFGKQIISLDNNEAGSAECTFSCELGAVSEKETIIIYLVDGENIYAYEPDMLT